MLSTVAATAAQETAAGLTLATAVVQFPHTEARTMTTQPSHPILPGSDYRTPGHIRPALTPWCLQAAAQDGWDLEKSCRLAKEAGVRAVEVVGPEAFPVLAKHGLACALTSSHGYFRGMNNALHHEECLAALRKSIDASAAAGFPNVVTFTGFADTTRGEDGKPVPGGSMVDLEEGIRNCVEGYKRIVGQAEKAGITLCLEALNTRDAAAMRGHPGYQGAHLDYILEVIREVGSPALKLLLDAYHVQIMDGDLIRRIREVGGEGIGHVQVAGVPGRGELDATQEVNWLAVMRALDQAGYRGWVGLEFIPTGDRLAGVRQGLQALGMYTEA